MTYKHDFSSLTDHELQLKYKSISRDLDGGKTYWDSQAVGRDHNVWSQLRDEIKRREKV